MDDAQSAGSSLFVITLCGSRENNWLVDFLWVVDKRRSTVARETYMTRLRMKYSVLQIVGRSRAHIKSRIESRDEAVSLQTALRPACSD